MKVSAAARRLGGALLLLAVGAVLGLGIAAGGLPPETMREYFLSRGEQETGAINLVSAIYLGYRAFDTFGETIVLLLAVSGVLFLVEKKEGDDA